MRWLALLLLCASTAEAEPRPVPRPAAEIEVMSATGSTLAAPALAAVVTSSRPRARVDAQMQQMRTVAAAMQSDQPVIDDRGLVRRSSRPVLRDDEIILAASRRPRPANSGGGLCGRGTIRGEVIPAVVGSGACGIPNPVRITAVSGVQLTTSARMDCDTAVALDTWVRSGLLPEVGRRGGGPVAIRVAAGYACRGRNNQAGARLSEHAKGRAIDISGILLADGSEISVLRDWGRGADGRLLRALHRRACGIFGTVLGPESDRFHQDHFHFDTAQYRSGSYCR